MPDIFELVIFLAVLLVSASVHEMMHAYVALRLGDDLAHAHGRISLNPLRHIDPFLTILLPTILFLLSQPLILAAKPVPINTSRIRGEEMGLAAVGVAGPLTNLAMAFIAGTFLQVVDPQGLLLSITELFVVINITLFVFNMLPIPPLDGSRLLYAVAPQPVQAFMRTIESFGLFGLIAILLVAGPIITPIIQTAQNFMLNLVL